jgi:CheY-like chemotaxis protein
MGRMIDDLLELSRISRGKLELRKEHVELVELVHRTCEDLRRQAEQHELRLQTELSSSPIWVHGDPTRLAQILVNLVDNAMKFSNVGGVVTIRLARSDDGHTCLLTVQDTGAGMAEEMLARAFEPFRQGDHGVNRGQSGLGLGLALVKGLTELHGGHVTAVSAGVGQGSQFQIQLPVVQHLETPNRDVASPAAVEHCFRILIIDDSRDVTYPLNTVLTRMGHEIKVAENGEEGVRTAKQFLPDLVLCDIGLPDISGYDVAHALRSDPATRRAYLVAATGYGQEDDRRRIAEAGFDQHLVKPVGLPVLRELLATFASRLGSGK